MGTWSRSRLQASTNLSKSQKKKITNALDDYEGVAAKKLLKEDSASKLTTLNREKERQSEYLSSKARQNEIDRIASLPGMLDIYRNYYDTNGISTDWIGAQTGRRWNNVTEAQSYLSDYAGQINSLGDSLTKIDSSMLKGSDKNAYDYAVSRYNSMLDDYDNLYSQYQSEYNEQMNDYAGRQNLKQEAEIQPIRNALGGDINTAGSDLLNQAAQEMYGAQVFDSAYNDLLQRSRDAAQLRNIAGYESRQRSGYESRGGNPRHADDEDAHSWEPSILDRVKNTITGGAKQWGASQLETPVHVVEQNNGTLINSANRNGKGSQGVYQEEYESLQREKEALIAQMASDPGDVYQQRQDKLQLRNINAQLKIYEDAIRANEGTAVEAQGLVNDIALSGYQDIQAAKNDLGWVGQRLVDIGSSSVGMGLDVALGRGLMGGYDALSSMALRSFGGSLLETQNSGMSENQRLLDAFQNAAWEVVSEKLFGGNAAYDVDAGIVSRVVNALVKNENVLAWLNRVGGSMAFDVAAEGLEEVVTGVMEPLTEYLITHDASSLDDITLSNLTEQFVVGAGMGGFSQAGALVGKGLSAAAGGAVRTAYGMGGGAVPLNVTAFPLTSEEIREQWAARRAEEEANQPKAPVYAIPESATAGSTEDNTRRALAQAAWEMAQERQNQQPNVPEGYSSPFFSPANLEQAQNDTSGYAEANQPESNEGVEEAPKVRGLAFESDFQRDSYNYLASKNGVTTAEDTGGKTVVGKDGSFIVHVGKALTETAKSASDVVNKAVQKLRSLGRESTSNIYPLPRSKSLASDITQAEALLRKGGWTPDRNGSVVLAYKGTNGKYTFAEVQQNYNGTFSVQLGTGVTVNADDLADVLDALPKNATLTTRLDYENDNYPGVYAEFDGGAAFVAGTNMMPSFKSAISDNINAYPAFLLVDGERRDVNFLSDLLRDIDKGESKAASGSAEDKKQTKNEQKTSKKKAAKEARKSGETQGTYTEQGYTFNEYPNESEKHLATFKITSEWGDPNVVAMDRNTGKALDVKARFIHSETKYSRFKNGAFAYLSKLYVDNPPKNAWFIVNEHTKNGLSTKRYLWDGEKFIETDRKGNPLSATAEGGKKEKAPEKPAEKSNSYEIDGYTFHEKPSSGEEHLGTYHYAAVARAPVVSEINNETGEITHGSARFITSDFNRKTLDYQAELYIKPQEGITYRVEQYEPEYSSFDYIWDKKANSFRAVAKSEAEESEEKPVEKPVEKTESKQLTAAKRIAKMIQAGTAFSNAKLFEICDAAFGGTQGQGAYSVKDAYDAMELAINLTLVDADFIKNANGDAATAKQTVGKLINMLSKLPSRSKRSEEEDRMQQFSTPPNIAYLAAWAANINKNDTVLEPSAGIGGLALFAKAWGAETVTNELSERRRAFLEEMGFDRVYDYNAEMIDDYLPDDVKPSIVIMNPPFSSNALTSGKNTKNAEMHIESALNRLNEGGRLVAILGRGMADDSKTFAPWWNDLRKKYTIQANIRIDGENYKKYGTNFDIQLVVIDKTGPQTGGTLTASVDDLSAVPELLEAIRNGRTESGLGKSTTGRSERGTGGAGSSEGERSVQRGGKGEQPVRKNGDTKLGGSGESSVQGTEGVGKPGGGSSAQPEGNSESVGGSGENIDSGRVPGEGGNSVSTDGRKPGVLQGGTISVSTDKGTEGAPKLSKEETENVEVTYAEYKPSKVHIKGAQPHPAKLVESAAMSAVQPPDVTYSPALPEWIATTGTLSEAQLENVVYAGQSHEKLLPNGERQGYFIGDGTGVGKGRQIAGIIYDNFLQGRKKAVWISEKNDLFNDASRDLVDVMGNSASLINFTADGVKKEKRVSIEGKLSKKSYKINADEGILFLSYTTLVGQGSDAKLNAIKEWLGNDFDGVIVYDEAHNMAGLNQKKAPAKAINNSKLQDTFRNARVVYASATGASEIEQYAYLKRLGLWGKGTAFKDFNEFMTKIQAGGIAAMEVVARDMKAQGLYMARSISYEGVEYRTLEHKLTKPQTRIYNTSAQAWQVSMQHLEDAVSAVNGDNYLRGQIRSQFFSAEQRFFNSVLTSMSVPSLIEDMQKQLDAGKSIVIQLTQTEEAKLNRALAQNAAEGGDLDMLDLSPSKVLHDMVEQAWPIEMYREVEDKDGRKYSEKVYDKDGKPLISKQAVRDRDAFLKEIDHMTLPEAPLDLIINTFGEENVAEITGRSKRVVRTFDDNGNTKTTLEKIGSDAKNAETDAFQSGKKRILIFSEAGGTGRSYHADRRAANQQQRVHYLLQAGWNSMKALQGFGRTHRSNEVSAPEYVLVTTNVLGQKRFTSTIARRLNQLGALTKGQREASGGGMFSERDNLENLDAQNALYQYYEKAADRKALKSIGLDYKVYNQDGTLKDGGEAKNVALFLNRILALDVDTQNAEFEKFYSILGEVVDNAIANGTHDDGLKSLKAEKIEITDEKTIYQGDGGQETKYLRLKVYNKARPVSLEAAKDRHLGRFQSLIRMKDGSIRAVYQGHVDTDAKTGRVTTQYILEGAVYGDTITRNTRTLLNNGENKFIPEEEWESAWEEALEKAPKVLETTQHMITGVLLPIWDKIPETGKQLRRIVTNDGSQYLGLMVQNKDIDSTLAKFGVRQKEKSGTIDPTTVFDAVLKNGATVHLTMSKQVLSRARVSGEYRVEITGDNTWNIDKDYEGVIHERINWQDRYFFADSEAGRRGLLDLLKDNQPLDMTTGRARGDSEQSLHYAKAADAGSTQSVKANSLSYPKQWTAKRNTDAQAVAAKTLTEIFDEIERELGVHIGKGHLHSRTARGEYNMLNNSVRTLVSNDLPPATHEVGHALDNRYGITTQDFIPQGVQDDLRAALGKLAVKYKKKDYLAEGWAEFVREYMRSKDEALKNFPDAVDWMRRMIDPRDLAKLEAIADDTNAYYALGGESAADKIVPMDQRDTRPLPERMKEKAQMLYQTWVDPNYGIQRFSKAIGNNRPYIFATNAAYSDAIAGQMIFGNYLTDSHGKYIGRGLRTALEGVNLNDAKEYQLFGEYLVVSHGWERKEEDGTIYRVFSDDRQNNEKWMKARQAVLEKEHPNFKPAAQRLYKFERDFLEAWGVQTGLVSREKFNEWGERWKNYVPFNRYLENQEGQPGAKRGFANQNSTIKKAHGSGLLIYNPVDSIMVNMTKMINAATRNNVMRVLTGAALANHADASWLERIPKDRALKRMSMREEKFNAMKKLVEAGFDTEDDRVLAGMIVMDMNDFLYQFQEKAPHGNIVTVLKGGETEYWQINDPGLLDSVTTLSPAQMNGILEGYAMISRFMTSNITGNNLLWNIFSNMPRDLMTAMIYGKNKNIVKLFKGIADAYVAKTKDWMGKEVDQYYVEYLGMGGGKTSAYTADRSISKRARARFMRKGRDFVPYDPLTWLSFLSDTIEAGPRYSTYKYLREQGYDTETAFYEAMDITVNFRRGGKYSRQLNKVVPFFNAGVQGLDKFGRWITAAGVSEENGQRAKAVRARTITWIAASAAIATILYAINNGDDDKKKFYQQLSNYTKNSYFVFPMGDDGKYFAIPKPRELGVLTSFFESLLEYSEGGNKDAYDEFYSYAVTNFFPSIASDILQLDYMGGIGSLGIIGVFAYLGANRDFLGRPIVSESMSAYESKDQYTQRTSKIAYWIGQAFNQSPQQIDYFMEQVLGGWWKNQKALFPVGAEERDWSMGVRNQYVKDSQYSTDIVNNLYDYAEESEKAKNSDPENGEKVLRYKLDSNMTSFYSRYYKLSKNTDSDSEVNRETRQTVLDMINEYLKAREGNEQTPAEQRAYNASTKLNDTSGLPSVMQNTIKTEDVKGEDGRVTKSGRTYTLTAQQYVQFQTDYNTVYWETLEDAFAASDGKAKTDMQIMKAAKEVALAQATAKALKKLGYTGATDYQDKYSGISNEDVAIYKALVDAANDNGSLKQEDYINILETMLDEGYIDQSDASTFFRSRYDSDKNNPWKMY